NTTSPSDFYTLSLHDALPIFVLKIELKHRNWLRFMIFVLEHSHINFIFILLITGDLYLNLCLCPINIRLPPTQPCVAKAIRYQRSEEHTSELQSRFDLVCRLL